MEHRLRRERGIRYVTADLLPVIADLKLDLTDLELPDGAFDAIICSHVLEHITNDAIAMQELHRILTPGGWAIVMVPIDHKRATTYEDPSITTPKERERAYWQSDHVRLYAPDVVDRLAAVGFLVERHSMVDELGETTAVRYGLIPVDEVLLCRR